MSSVYSTYLGGSSTDSGNAIAVDASGNAYVAGSTTSTNFPTASPLQAANAGGTDAFVAKYSSTGSAYAYSAYLGGSSTESGLGIATDSSNNACLTGSTTSTNFPTANARQPASGGGTDGFVARLSPAANLAISMTATPNPVPVNGDLTYTINIINNGELTATGA